MSFKVFKHDLREYFLVDIQNKMKMSITWDQLAACTREITEHIEVREP